MNRVWCVAHIIRNEKGAVVHGENGRPMTGWCATKNGRGFKEGINSVPTLCDYFIILPCGKEKREPTCPDCRRRLAN